MKQRSRRLLQSIVSFALGELEGCDRVKVSFSWVSDKVLRVHTTLRDLVELTTRDDLGEALKKPQVAEALNRMKDFLEILVDERVHDQGSEDWLFTLKLWSRDIPENLRSFEMEWENRRSPQSKAVTAAIGGLQTSGLKPGVPMPKFKPVVWVDRPKPLQEVKDLLLGMMEQTLSIAAVYGLGGIGKSVLAKVLIEDAEVQQNFPDGILWKTLGQNPDLQNCLGDWIRELDKSRDSFSATTLESASGYLHNLLAERRMLLVVDDVWDAAHAEWFRVGGAGCRVLVTTRAAYIPGAVRYDLALMSPDEALKLMQNELGHQWTAEMEKPAREFSKSLGYLPLALKLMAVQVGRGRSWENLRKAFFEERVRLRMLDQPGVKLADLSEEKQRDYSLRACLQLSLRWLEPEQLSKFTWLGVLPEDATIRQGMAMVLWDVADWEAEEGLLALYESSLLSRGADTWDGEATYRVHDLLHVLAKELIEQPRTIVGKDSLVGLGLSFADAQVQFLERYRGQSGDGSWYGLANDGYIHRHLTWHLEMAGRCDQVHELMASGEDQNDWFEACDKIGQPGIFVEDVRRSWRLAEELYETDRGRAIVLQCRYALITGTLNSLVGNFSGELLSELVKEKIWSIEKAWAYLEQIQDEEEMTSTIVKLAPYLSNFLLNIAVKKVRSIQGQYHRAFALSSIAEIDYSYFSEALATTRGIYEDYRRAEILCLLSKIDPAYFFEALDTVRLIQDEYPHPFTQGYHLSCRLLRADLLSALSEINKICFPEALDAVRRMKNTDQDYYQAQAFQDLAKIDNAYFFEVLDNARAIKNDNRRYHRTQLLTVLARIDSNYFSEALDSARLIDENYFQVLTLSDLAEINSSCFLEALKVSKSIHETQQRVQTLNNLVGIDNIYLSEIFNAVNLIQDSYIYSKILIHLTTIDNTYLDNASESMELVSDMDDRAWNYVSLAEIDSTYLPKAVESGCLMKDTENRAILFGLIAGISEEYFDEALEKILSIKDYKFGEVLTFPPHLNGCELGLRCLIDSNKYDLLKILNIARSILDDKKYARILVECARSNSSYLSKAVELANVLRDNECQAWLFARLAGIDSTYISKALGKTRKIKHNLYRTQILSEIARVDDIHFSEALESARSIEYIEQRMKALIGLLQVNSSCLSEVLETAKLIQEKSGYADILSDLVENCSESSLSHVYRAIAEIPDSSDRAIAISSYIDRLPLDRLPYIDWKTYLHLLAHRTRADLMGDLATLYPAILHLGGEDAGRGMVGEMGRVCKQWK